MELMLSPGSIRIKQKDGSLVSNGDLHGVGWGDVAHILVTRDEVLCGK